MGEVVEINKDLVPAQEAFTSALGKCIQDFAVDKLTCIEVLGGLDYVGKKFYEMHLMDNDE